MRDFTGWRYYTDVQGVNIGIIFTHQDGRMESKSISDIEVSAWLSSGGIPLGA